MHGLPQPTNFFWPAQFPGGPAQKVFVCPLGCLVLEPMLASHTQLAHP